MPSFVVRFRGGSRSHEIPTCRSQPERVVSSDHRLSFCIQHPLRIRRQVTPNLPLLDLSCLRTFLAVAQTGSITAGADLVNLSQSAASLHIRRLEEMLDCVLLTRQARGTSLTASGEALLIHARRMIDLNREIVGSLKAGGPDRPLTLGAPHDIIQPLVPQALRAFQRDHIRKIRLVSASTRSLRMSFERGELDMMLTTDANTPAGSTCLAPRKLAWVSAPDSRQGLVRPLPVVFSPGCIIREIALSSLGMAGVAHKVVDEIADPAALCAAVAADQGVHALIADDCPSVLVPADPEFGLPALPDLMINLTLSLPEQSDQQALAASLTMTFASHQSTAGPTRV